MAYVSDVLARPAAGWPSSRLDELLPENWSLGGGAVGIGYGSF